MKKDAAALLQKAEAYCAKKDLRFTDPRRRVLAAIAQSGKAMGAYDVLDALPRGTKPPTVYRAIEFLREHGFIHRIESMNAYVACNFDHCHEGVQFLVCDSCRKVVETHVCKPPPALAAQAQEQGFRFRTWNAELHGTCSACG